MKMKKLLVSLCLISANAFLLYASSFDIETDYRNRYMSYTNIDFNDGTSSDTISYTTQRLRLSFRGIFDTGSPDFGEQVEICTKLQALEIIGTSTSVPFFTWQDQLPYPRKDFMPFIENSYVKVSNLSPFPLHFTVGRQPLNYGSGLIVADNGIGYDSMRLDFEYPKKVNFDILLASKIKKGFIYSGDSDLSGIMIKGPWKESSIETCFFQESDRSGTLYSQGLNSEETTLINKSFMGFRLGKSNELSYYNFELALQQGHVTTKSDKNISLNGGKAYTISGGVNRKEANGSTLSYRGMISVASGDDNIDDLYDDDASFCPSFGKKFDGLELAGYGIFLGESPTMTSVDVNKRYYSGFNVIQIGTTYSPAFGFEYGADWFLFSASEASALLGEFTSNFEKNILQTKYNLGGELNAFVRYFPSKYISFKLTFARYTPPNYTTVWPTNKTCEMLVFETSCKF